MSHLNLVSATDTNAESQLNELNQNLTLFYNRPEISEYFYQAHNFNETWTKDSYHWLVRQQISSGMSILDLGCGSGHVFANLQNLNISYTGVDWSKRQIQENVNSYAEKASFISASLYDTNLESNSYDVVLSFYVLEHLVWPHLFLKEMFRLTKPGGMIIILCPNFRGLGRIPSLQYGKIVAPLKEKLNDGNIIDAFLHFGLRNIYYPDKIKNNYPQVKFPFLINLNPTCLSGKYYIDNDAIYFVDEEEVKSELCSFGCEIITSTCFEQFGRKNKKDKDTCFIVAIKQKSNQFKYN